MTLNLRAESSEPQMEAPIPQGVMKAPPSVQTEGKTPRKAAVRMPVRRFSLLMELKLRKNDHKGGWSDTTLETLLELLEDEVRELRDAIRNGDPLDIAQECADVGNYAMMIADNSEGI